MPRYDYRCSTCGVTFEDIHGVDEPQPTTCPTVTCKAPNIFKVLTSPPAFILKGSGWTPKGR